jgi:hypothetical protein
MMTLSAAAFGARDLRAYLDGADACGTSTRNPDADGARPQISHPFRPRALSIRSSTRWSSHLEARLIAGELPITPVTAAHRRRARDLAQQIAADEARGTRATTGAQLRASLADGVHLAIRGPARANCGASSCRGRHGERRKNG